MTGEAVREQQKVFSEKIAFIWLTVFYLELANISWFRFMSTLQTLVSWL